MAFPPVLIYYLPVCPACKMTKDFLASHQVPFTAIDVSSPERMEELKAKTGANATPVIIIGGEQSAGTGTGLEPSLGCRPGDQGPLAVNGQTGALIGKGLVFRQQAPFWWKLP